MAIYFYPLKINKSVASITSVPCGREHTWYVFVPSDSTDAEKLLFLADTEKVIHMCMSLVIQILIQTAKPVCLSQQMNVQMAQREFLIQCKWALNKSRWCQWTVFSVEASDLLIFSFHVINWNKSLMKKKRRKKSEHLPCLYNIATLNRM